VLLKQGSQREPHKGLKFKPILKLPPEEGNLQKLPTAGKTSVLGYFCFAGDT
jgi:hypothetical protein